MRQNFGEAFVETLIENHIATITFFHPQSNSLPGEVLRTLANHIHTAGKEKDVHVIVLKSEGEKVFCAGASFDELAAIYDEASGLEFFSGFAKVINAMRTCGKIVIARIQGKCVGGGVGIAAAADYSIAVQQSAIKLSELAVGIGPFVVGPAIERKIGTGAFTQLALDAHRWRDAAWARRNNLFAEVYDDAAALDQAVSALANQLAKSSQEALHQLKQVFWEGTNHWDELLLERAAMSGRLILSDFSKQFITNFKQKNA